MKRKLFITLGGCLSIIACAVALAVAPTNFAKASATKSGTNDHFFCSFHADSIIGVVRLIRLAEVAAQEIRCIDLDAGKVCQDFHLDA